MLITTPVASREAVSAARWPVPEERRTVTVLFVDIVGSTGLVERLDPEDVRTLQRAYFGTVSGVLRRWRGVVEKYVGDAVMALFGAHDCDGFDAYRAVRAGLEIQAALDRRPAGGTRLRVRVGVATGEVLVDLTGARDGGHGAASGAVITTAARLQEYAPPGGVVVCPSTRRAVAGLVEQRPLATMTMAGKAGPVGVWRVTGVSRHRPARHHGPLVGRRRELAGAADEVVRALRERRPGWISLAGPPGSGRSRLLHELTRAVSRVDGAEVRWCVAHCPPYPDGELAPLADLVRALLTPDPAVRPLPGSTAGGPGWAAASPALAAFLAAPDDPAAASRAVAACRELLLDRAAGAPVVVAVDDLDRAAPALHRFLRHLHATAGERRLALAVVTTHSAGRADPSPGPGERWRRVWLAPLGARDSGRLLRHLLDRADRPAALAARLLPLVGGNPAVATAYAAEDSGDEPAGVPAAARRLVDARLDRLDGAQRAVLMAGATAGGALAPATVERMLGWAAGRAGPVLRTLAAAGLLRRTRAGGWTIAEPVVARMAAYRLPRAARADFARRLRGDGTNGRPGAVPATRRPGAASRLDVPRGDVDGRATCPLGVGRSRRSGGGARPAPVPPIRAASHRPGYAAPVASGAGPPTAAAPPPDAAMPVGTAAVAPPRAAVAPSRAAVAPSRAAVARSGVAAVARSGTAAVALFGAGAGASSDAGPVRRLGAGSVARSGSATGPPERAGRRPATAASQRPAALGLAA
ncbi:Adenylate cyclase, class 3 [Micromonospora sediminicola]|uniref:Adenylate cyclase, class 3 n=1 Tax=Micromonospora sediminicola TaxID=946078 RepID=A0A1A9BBP5_9ACTN|nr:adenylate/guanylate cyclase domain-containing protein [Micromonospora sediminicola]SBT66312.1 Adenylate cyclase, class 3 [Micromonospora sediminicola]